MKKITTIVLMFLLCSAAVFSHAKDKKLPQERQNYVQQQMILMGLYIHGINQELAKEVPNYDEMEFLADSLLEITNQLKQTKNDFLFHRHLNRLVKNIEELKTLSQTDHDKAKDKAQEVINSCASCHTRGLENISPPLARQ